MKRVQCVMKIKDDEEARRYFAIPFAKTDQAQLVSLIAAAQRWKFCRSNVKQRHRQ